MNARLWTAVLLIAVLAVLVLLSVDPDKLLAISPGHWLDMPAAEPIAPAGPLQPAPAAAADAGLAGLKVPPPR